MGARPGRNDNPGRLMARCYGRAVKKLWAFRTAQGVGANPKQQLALARLWHLLFNEFDLFVPDERGNPTAGRN